VSLPYPVALGLGRPRSKPFFEACPIVTLVVTYGQLIFMYLVYIHIECLHKECWPGWNTAEITWGRIKTYSELYFPSALSSASDFWRVAVIGGVAARMGEQEVAVYNTAYRITWLSIVFVVAMAGASSTIMCLRLGRNDPSGARQAGYVGVGMSFTVLVVLSIFILVKSRWFGLIFTNDEDFLLLFEEASVPFTAFLFFMDATLVLEQIPYTMGRTRDVFWMGFTASWGFQVPAVVLLTRHWRDDLVGLYTGMAIGNFLLTIIYSFVVVRRSVSVEIKELSSPHVFLLQAAPPLNVEPKCRISFRSDWVKYAELTQLRSESTALIASSTPPDGSVDRVEMGGNGV
jgi:Na+-driven multidrug efflux pump